MDFTKLSQEDWSILSQKLEEQYADTGEEKYFQMSEFAMMLSIDEEGEFRDGHLEKFKALYSEVGDIFDEEDLAQENFQMALEHFKNGLSCLQSAHAGDCLIMAAKHLVELMENNI